MDADAFHTYFSNVQFKLYNFKRFLSKHPSSKYHAELSVAQPKEIYRKLRIFGHFVHSKQTFIYSQFLILF